MNYNIIGLKPFREASLAQFSFMIELDYAYACQMYASQLNERDEANLQRLGKDLYDSVWIEMDWQDGLFQRRKIYNFWEGTCLLTNVCVEPGNACGLDMEHHDFDDIKRGLAGRPRPVRYLPHNVDALFQAYALLGAWLEWYNHSLVMSGEGGLFDCFCRGCQRKLMTRRGTAKIELECYHCRVKGIPDYTIRLVEGTS